MIRITSRISIGDSEISESFIRASGPGGQNVNKVSTAVQLRFDAANSPALSVSVFRRLRRLAGRRMTRDGVLIIEARNFRTRESNRRDARDRLLRLIRKASQAPRIRRKTKSPPRAKERRLEIKKRRAQTKTRRGTVRGFDV